MYNRTGFEPVRQKILTWLLETIQVPVEKIDLDKPLVDFDLDSIDAVNMIAFNESIIRQKLPENVIQKVTCLSDIFEMMRAHRRRIEFVGRVIDPTISYVVRERILAPAY